VFQKAYDSFERGVLYSIVIEFVINMGLVIAVRAWLGATYLKVGRGKHLSKNSLKQGDALWPLHFSLVYNML
jgi:hypothetical protein